MNIVKYNMMYRYYTLLYYAILLTVYNSVCCLTFITKNIIVNIIMHILINLKSMMARLDEWFWV